MKNKNILKEAIRRGEKVLVPTDDGEKQLQFANQGESYPTAQLWINGILRNSLNCGQHEEFGHWQHRIAEVFQINEEIVESTYDKWLVDECC